MTPLEESAARFAADRLRSVLLDAKESIYG